MSQVNSDNKEGKNNTMSPDEFFDEVLKDNPQEHTEKPALDQTFGTPKPVAERRRLHREYEMRKASREESPKRKPEPIRVLEQDKVREKGKAQTDKMPPHLLKEEKRLTELDDLAVIGTDGQIIEENRSGKDFEHFDVPIDKIKSNEPEKAAKDGDNKKRAKDAVLEPEIKVHDVDQKVVKTPPQIGIAMGRPHDSVPKDETRSEPPAEKPEITIDEIQPPPKEEIHDEIYPDIGEALENGASGSGLTNNSDINSSNITSGEEKTVVPDDQAEQQGEEKIPITFDKTIQPVGAQLEGPNLADNVRKDSDQAGTNGTERINKIKEGISKNTDEKIADNLGESEGREPDKFDQQVLEERKDRLKDDGMDPNQIKTDQALVLRPAIKPEVTVNDDKSRAVDGNGDGRIVVNQQPVRNPFGSLEQARTIARQPDIDSSALAGLRPGTAARLEELEQDELPKAA